jgi:hypothetical protein
VYFVQFVYRDKKVVGVFVRFSCAAPSGESESSPWLYDQLYTKRLGRHLGS